MHWDITSFDWDGPQDVGDQLEIGFQVSNLDKLRLPGFDIRFTFLVTRQTLSMLTLMGQTIPFVDHVSLSDFKIKSMHCNEFIW